MSELAYAISFEDEVRSGPELRFYDRLVTRLLQRAGGGRVVDLGCGDGTVEHLGGGQIEEYLGVDYAAPSGVPHLSHDLREGLGPVGTRPFDLYLGTFGVASHLEPAELDRLLADIAAHGRPGSLVAVEALGLLSLEWPRLWDTEPGPARELPYKLAHDVTVHPWLPGELAERFARAGLHWLGARDRTVQFGPKLGDERYWPGLPALRPALGRLLAGDPAGLGILAEPLPPLPVGATAAFHHALAERRRDLVRDPAHMPAGELAERLWGLEPATGLGHGHGLMALGRVA